MDRRHARVLVVMASLLVFVLSAMGAGEPVEPAGTPPTTLTKTKPFAVQAAAPDQAYPGQTFRLRYTVYMLDNTHYLYKDACALTLEKVEGVNFGPVHFWPQPAQKFDPYESKVMEVYHVPVTLYVEGTVSEDARLGSRQVEARISYRGCNASVCFFPVKETITRTLEIVAKPEDATL